MLEESKSFKKLSLNHAILDNLNSLGYLEMTPIQEKGLPFILNNQDFIGQANTGSGKTAAFALGVLAKLDVANLKPQALIIVPTRELSEQVAAETRRLARFANNIKILTLSGGSQEKHAVKSLKQGAHIIIGTAGRIFKLLDTGMLVTSEISTLVLDEADRLLEMGSIKEIEHIASFLPLNRQTMLFSATFPNGIRELSAALQEEAAQVTIDSQHQSNNIEQVFFKVEGDKTDELLRVLANYKPESGLIFCNSKETCTKVAGLLRKNKMNALEIHSSLDQKDRILTLIKFANKSCRFLVATDLASRGLDIKDVHAVVNYDLPYDCELYVHRIGRTGRAGKEGLALSLYTLKENKILKSIEEYLKIDCESMTSSELKKFKPVALKSEMTTIYISGGKKNSIRPGDILGALTKEVGLKKEDVGKIDILDVNTYVAIVNEKVTQTVKALNAGKIKGKKFKVGRV
jgi:ATP-independent RNA helicase DbpA